MDFLVENALKSQEQFKFAAGNNAGQANIKVIGCGGAGNNTVSWLYNKGVEGAETIVLNTDIQHLNISNADQKILVGKELTRGLGAGGHPQIGAQAVEESQHEVKQLLKGSDLLFLCAGMGGGTGTGSAPVVARLAKELGSIVIGVVTMPFNVERARVDKAEYGLQLLREYCDSVIVIDNNKLVQIAGNLPMAQSFAVANELISTMIKGIVETIALPSLINLDFADVKAIMKMGGLCIMGIGESYSEHKAEEAVKRALNNPLLDVDISNATGALVNIIGGNDLSLDEAKQIISAVGEKLSPDAKMIWGAQISPEMEKAVRVMLIITGVKSTQITGTSSKPQEFSAQTGISEELGIDFLE
jgi:cell division protein FtsZ